MNKPIDVAVTTGLNLKQIHSDVNIEVLIFHQYKFNDDNNNSYTWTKMCDSSDSN